MGKTALWVAYAKNRLNDVFLPTVFDNYEKIVAIAGEEYHLIVQDTSGTKDFNQLRLLSYPDTDVIIAVFSFGSSNIYENVREKWIPEVNHHMSNVPIVLVGNQIHLRNDPECLKRLAEHKKKPITTEMGQKHASEINAAAYVECSCLDQIGVKNVFE